MKKGLQRFLSIFLVFVILCAMSNMSNVKAASASVSVSVSSNSISVGDTVTVNVYISSDEAIGYGVAVSYDSSVLEYIGGADGGGGGTVSIVYEGDGSSTSYSRSISFRAISSGNSSISTSSYAGGIYGWVSGSISASYGSSSVAVASTSTTEKPSTTEAPVTTTEPTTEDTTEATTEEEDDGKCFLKSLSISPGTLEPAFSSRTTSYFVQVDEDVTAIDVNAVAEYSSSRVSVSGASSISQGENHITITVTSENGATKNYYIQVMAGKEKGDPAVTINGKKLNFVLDKDIEDIPEGFRAVDETYEDWDIVAFLSPNKKLLLVCLEDENEKRSLYIYDKEKNIFTLYKEHFAGENRYVILAWKEETELPAGCEEAQLRIDGELIQAYRLDGDFYLLYAMNIEGDEGIYLYDYKEKTFMRYMQFIEKQEIATDTETTPADATAGDAADGKTEDEGFFTRQMLIYYLIGAAVVLLIFLITILCLLTKNRRLRKAAQEDEDKEAEAENKEEISEKKLEADEKKEEKFEIKNENSDRDKSMEEIAEHIINPDNQAENYAEYEKQSEEIKNKIKVSYNANMDSAFDIDE